MQHSKDFDKARVNVHSLEKVQKRFSFFWGRIIYNDRQTDSPISPLFSRISLCFFGFHSTCFSTFPHKISIALGVDLIFFNYYLLLQTLWNWRLWETVWNWRLFETVFNWWLFYEAGATFDNSFFDNCFVFLRQFKNRSFLGVIFLPVTGRSKN